MKKVKNKKILILAVLLFLTGCFKENNLVKEVAGDVQPVHGIVAQKNNILEKSSQIAVCNIPPNAFKKLPTDVLSGTDVVDFGSFKTALTSALDFQTEMGGATMELKLLVENDRYKLQHIYKEPEMPDSIAIYSNLCIQDAFLYGEGVRGVFTEKGVLWLELKSTHEFISSDLWIYLEKK